MNAPRSSWLRSRRGDIGIRFGGLSFVLASVFCIHQMAHLQQDHAVDDRWACSLTLAIVGFACASLGSALATIGNHFMDAIEISTRWSRH